MRRIIFLIFLTVAVGCGKKDVTTVQYKLSEATYPTFTQPTFDESYPDQLTYLDGTSATRSDDYLMLYFDSIPTLKDIATGLKRSEVRSLSSDSVIKNLNNTRQVMWVKKKGPGNLPTYIASLKRNLHGVRHVVPAYYFGDSPDGADFFAPLPFKLLVKDSLMNAELDSVFNVAGLERAQDLANYRIYKLEAGRNYTVFGLTDFIQALPGFNEDGAYYFENVPFMKPQFASPTDPLWQHQAITFNEISIPQAWAIVGPMTTRVAVIDCGLNLAYTDLNLINEGFQYNHSTIYPGARPDALFGEPDHGTGVTSLMVAKQNHIGISGVAPGFPVLPLAVVNGSDVELAAAILECVKQKVTVINMSVGTYSWKNTVINPVIESAWKSGCIMVAASGNDKKNNQLPMPAAHRRVMAVGGCNGNTHDSLSNYARIQQGSYWKGISVVAPSVNITTVNGNGVQWKMSGTSAASPLVAGVAALIKAKYPTLTNQQIRNAIEGSASKIGSGYQTLVGFPSGTHHPALGYGQLNAAAALQRATPPQASMVQTNLKESALVDEVNLNSRKLSAGMIMLIALAGSAFLIIRFTRK